MSYDSDDPATRLAAVRSAIADVLKSQAYTVAGRSQQRAQLRDLREMEKELMQEVAAAGGGFSLGQIDPVGLGD